VVSKNPVEKLLSIFSPEVLRFDLRKILTLCITHCY